MSGWEYFNSLNPLGFLVLVCLFLFLQDRTPGWNLAVLQNESLETGHPGRTLTVE